MRRVRVAFLTVLLAAGLGACQTVGPAEKATLDRLSVQQDKIFTKYEAYVRADQKLTDKEKDDEAKLLQSVRDMALALKRAFGE